MATLKVRCSTDVKLNLVKQLLDGSGCRILSIMYEDSTTGLTMPIKIKDSEAVVLLSGSEQHIAFFRYLYEKHVSAIKYLDNVHKKKRGDNDK